MRRTAFALILVLFACSDTADPGSNEGGNDGGAPPPAAASVTIGDNFYSPSSPTVAVDGTVTFTWSGSNPHTVTFDDPSIAAASQRTSGSTSRAFATAGEYTFYCQVHGRGMSGTVVVEAP